MTPSFNDAVDFTLRSEGLLSDNPRDAGGLTKFGITQATWTAWRSKAVAKPGYSIANLPASVAAITTAMALEVYYDEFWIEKLPRELQLPYFDFAVNSGPSVAAKKLQALLGVAADGDIGPATLAKMETLQSGALRKLRNDYVTARIVFLADDVQHRANDVDFIEGWMRRVTKLYDFAY